MSMVFFMAHLGNQRNVFKKCGEHVLQSGPFAGTQSDLILL